MLPDSRANSKRVVSPPDGESYGGGMSVHTKLEPNTLCPPDIGGNAPEPAKSAVRSPICIHFCPTAGPGKRSHRLSKPASAGCLSSRLMGGLTPLIWTALVVWGNLSWRWAFVLFGGIVVVWCVAFARWFRNRPEERSDVNAAELSLIRAGAGHTADAAEARVPWGRLLRSGNLWAVCVMYFCMAYGWYFNITYLPACLRDVYGVSDQSVVGAFYKGGPLWIGAVACLWGGWLTDRLVRLTGDHRAARRRQLPRHA